MTLHPSALILLALIGCGSGGRLVPMDSGSDVGHDAAGTDSGGHDSGEIIRGCPGIAGTVRLSVDAAAVTVAADDCSVFYGQPGGVLTVSTLNGAPCHITASLGDGGVTLSETVTFEPVSGCPGSYRLSGDSGFAADAGK